MSKLQIISSSNEKRVKEIFARNQSDRPNLRDTVKSIYNEITERGDEAIFEYTSRFDGVELSEIKVDEKEINEAKHQINDSLKHAINSAADNIRKFHAAQKRDGITVETMEGVTCWTKHVPIQRVGLYIPGGSAPLFSTLLMLAIPAVVANCPEIVLCTPPNKESAIDPTILYAASLCGVKTIYKVGGAQAIAAMAIGTKTIKKVDKIFGPGNAFVTEAKIQAQQMGIAIDLPAGPSEVLIIGDDSSNPNFIAADMLSQMEHGPDSQAVLLTCSEPLVENVLRSFEYLKKDLPRVHTIESACVQSAIIVAKDREELIRLMNEYAAEHLIIQTVDAEFLAEKVIHAGSVFVGPWSPESAGDYASGTNHTLPTYGYAKSYSGVNLDSFYRQITFQKLTEEGAALLGPIVCEMAKAEKLEAHALAMQLRMDSL